MHQSRLFDVRPEGVIGVRWVALKYVKPGFVLAQRVSDERGRTLLAQGIVLSESYIRRLNRVGVRAVCIHDRATDDVIVNEMVAEPTKAELLTLTYDTLSELGSGHFSPKMKPTFLRKKLGPLLEDVIQQLREGNGAGEQLGSVYIADGELFHHSVNVTFYVLTLGLYLNLPKDDLLNLGIGTLLHDVGKLRVRREVLQKPGRLTPEEFREIQMHSQYGFEILSALADISATSALIALQHHERMDGSGYPNGLMGDQIHLFSQLTAVVDVYEALTANRVYRQAYLPHEAFGLIMRDRGTRLSTVGVDAFRETISIYPLGMSVRLTNGDLAVVIQASAGNDQQPVVRAIENARGEPIRPYELDLRNSPDIQIETCES